VDLLPGNRQHHCESEAARLLKVPQDGCLNDRLALDVNDMINVTPSAKEQIVNITKVMTEAMVSLKNAAMLRNATDLKPPNPNATCWSGN